MKNYFMKSQIKNKTHLIFEGPELVGKSFLISQVYDKLEIQNNTDPHILNGCQWFNCDLNVFGTPLGKKIIDEYVKILKILENKNVLFEKFHLTDQVYNQIYRRQKIDYSETEKKLKKLGAKIILFTVKNKNIFADRLPDRLKNSPLYGRIAQSPEDYWQQQKLYLEKIKQTKLPYLIIDSSDLLNKKFVEKQVNKILNFIQEKK